MRICHLDAFSGISGDMTVGALVDVGADREGLTAALESLNTGAAFRFEKVQRAGVCATKFHVDGGEQKAHRHLPHILKMIAAAALPDSVKQKASAVFERLGAAEAAVHGVPVEKVHFHEVGAVDSIADIVGACYAFVSLNIEQISCSPLNLGAGTVKTEHGLLPVPAPATARLLEGFPVYSRGPQIELTTPTGAALATALSAQFGPLPPMTVAATGYGAGSHDFREQANVLRVLIGDTTGASESTTVSVLEANIDDASPQLLGYAMDRLLDAGALDVTLQPLFMKKNRPGTLLSVIARPQDRDSLARVILAETTTIGLRIYDAERRVQARSSIEVETPHGKVRIKVTSDGFAPEYEDCRRIALAAGVSLKQVIAEANYAYLKEF